MTIKTSDYSILHGYVVRYVALPIIANKLCVLSGLQYDSYKWWTDRSIHNFKERTQCFVDQYNQYDLQGHRVSDLF